MQSAADRPAYVEFEYRPVEDRDATLSAGHYMSKDVAYAIVMPVGSRDRIEKVVSEWFITLQQAIDEGRFPSEWLRGYRMKFEEWQRGNEMPESGTPIMTWPALSPAQAKSVIAANIRTVEDLAQANEVGLNAIGMGSRALKQRAVEWLASAQDIGKVAERVAALEAEAKDKDEQIKNQSLRIVELTAANKALSAKDK